MKKVSKLALHDGQGNYLLLRLNNHPTFGNSYDLPGGTVDLGESAQDAMVREVFEETGVAVDGSQVQQVYAGTDYSKHNTHYTLFTVQVDSRPEVALSWEHTDYEWLPLDEFLQKAKSAKDTYMHMVYDMLITA